VPPPAPPPPSNPHRQPRGPSYKVMPEEQGVLKVSVHPRWSHFRKQKAHMCGPFVFCNAP